MSYHWEPIYVCAICGAAEPASKWEDVPFGIRFLPDGWTGSERRNGTCYCDKCTDGIKRQKREVCE